MGFIECRTCLSDDGISLARELSSVLCALDGKKPAPSAVQAYQSMRDAGIDPIALAQAVLRIAMFQEEITVSGTMGFAEVVSTGDDSHEILSVSEVDIAPDGLDGMPNSAQFSADGTWFGGKFRATDGRAGNRITVYVDLGFIRE